MEMFYLLVFADPRCTLKPYKREIYYFGGCGRKIYRSYSDYPHEIGISFREIFIRSIDQLRMFKAP